MFYIKSTITDEVSVRTDITGENVFTTCPECGVEHPVDLVDIIREYEDFDFYGTALYCEECSRQRAVERMFQDSRELHPEQWEPDEADKPSLVAYFKENYEGIKDCCGDGEEAEEALELYKLVKHNPMRYTKEAIQGHFADMFSSVGGKIEERYSWYPEIIRLINLTVCPDPLEEV